MSGEHLTVVVPTFNEADNLPVLLRRLIPVLEGLDMHWQVLFVDDGSTDGTRDAILGARERDNRIQLLRLSRNFGKEKAMTAGLDHAGGDAVVILDADLQHPVELIPELVVEWRRGHEVVYGVRRNRKREVLPLAWLKHGFYGIYNRVSKVPVPVGAGDFRLLDRRVVDVLGTLRERERFMKGLYAWVGFRQTGVPYDVDDRASAGSRWSLRSLWQYAITGLTSFSSLPLIVWSYIGIAIAILGFIYGSYIVVRTLIVGVELPGFATLSTLILFIGGLLLMSIGIIGEYLGRMYEEVKSRPLYVIENRWGVSLRADRVCDACHGTGRKAER